MLVKSYISIIYIFISIGWYNAQYLNLQVQKLKNNENIFSVQDITIIMNSSYKMNEDKNIKKYKNDNRSLNIN